MSQPALPQSPLLKALQAKNTAVAKQLETKHAHVHKWLDERNLSIPKLRAHSAKLLTGATLSSALLLASPHLSQVGIQNAQVASAPQTQDQFLKLLRDKPQLTPEQESLIETSIKKHYNLTAAFELDNNRIPYYFGRVGLEQHLYRFPGDTLNAHGAFIQAGIAPARGAFGYFSESGKPLSQMEAEEKYYLVLQTFLIPEWNSEWQHLKEWYKFRKFLMINPATGRAVVGVLGDSGPGVSTGKKFGASPEAMAAMGFYPRATSGDVVVLFLDDPGNTVPLGPVFMGQSEVL